VSSLDFWEAFSEDWQVLLDESPRLRYFKMREAARAFGGKMKREALHERIHKFFKLIHFATQASISSIVPIEAHRRIVKGKLPIKEWDDPYFLAMFDIIMKLFWNQVSTKSVGTLEFIFDDNPRLAAKVPAYYQLMRAMIAPKYRHLIAVAPKFEDDIEFLPLQAADAQSWYYRRLFAEKFRGEPFPETTPKTLFSELDRIPAMLSAWLPARLEAFAKQEHLPDDNSPIPSFKDIHDLLDKVDFGVKGK
jgi:hypothetical protein